MGKNKKSKFILSNEEIDANLTKAKQLIASGQIEEKIVPYDYWCQGQSSLNYQKHLWLAVVLGFVAADRFYLKKYVSAVVKLLSWVFLFPAVTALLITTNLVGEYPAETIVFTVLFYGFALGYYLVDIYIAITKPRDHNFHCLVKYQTMANQTSQLAKEVNQ